MTQYENDLDRVSHAGMLAYKRIKTAGRKVWADWIAVGQALASGRAWAMRQAGANQPTGKGYNLAMGQWLTDYKLDTMDRSDRVKLLAVIENLPSIEQWRATLTEPERLRLNHPVSVLAKWKAAMGPEPKPAEPKPSKRDADALAIADLQAQNDELRERVKELEEERDQLRSRLNEEAR